MPAVYNPRHQCDGKIRFTTKRDAKRCAKAWEQTIGRMHAYRCPWCHRWHIGHRPPKPSQIRSINSLRESDSPGAVASCPGPDRPERP